MSRVEKYAQSYSEGWNIHVQKAAYKSFLAGYDQCIEDVAPDMDEYQARLSQLYSDIKVKYIKKVEKIITLEKILIQLRDGLMKPDDIDEALRELQYKIPQ